MSEADIHDIILRAKSSLDAIIQQESTARTAAAAKVSKQRHPLDTDVDELDEDYVVSTAKNRKVDESISAGNPAGQTHQSVENNNDEEEDDSERDEDNF